MTTAGGVEEDFIKCFGDFYVGNFRANEADMFEISVNRQGNIYVPESHYHYFTDFMQPILEDMMDEQNKHVCYTQHTMNMTDKERGQNIQFLR